MSKHPFPELHIKTKIQWHAARVEIEDPLEASERNKQRVGERSASFPLATAL